MRSPFAWFSSAYPRLVSLFECLRLRALSGIDNSQGLTVMCRTAKMMLQPLKDVIEPTYQAGITDSQFGALGGGGTDFGHHIVLEAISYAANIGLNILVLFLDLVF